MKKEILKILSVNPAVREGCVRLRSFYRRTRNKLEYERRYATQENLILFESYKGRNYSCSPRAVYEEMIRDSRYDDFKKVWAFEDPECYGDLAKRKDTIVVRHRSKKYFRYAAQAKYWVTNSRMLDEIQKKKDQVYIQCWHGTPLKRLGFDVKVHKGGAQEERELNREYEYDAMKYDYIISPSPFYTEKITSAFNLKALGKEDIFVEKGYPRNDFLYQYTEEQADEVRRKLGIPQGKKVILYAPTWRDSMQEVGVGCTYSLGLDFTVLQKEFKEECVILFRTHYFIKNVIDLKQYEGFVFDVSDYGDINDLYIISDLLMTDYSSVFFDYANLKRPIIYYMYDFEQYKNEMRDFYIDIDTLPGRLIKTEGELPGAIREALDASPWDEKYRRFNEIYNPHSGENASRAVLETCIGLHR